jgi:FKBP-type peptidyl-prolyl cis-trans isomerase
MKLRILTLFLLSTLAITSSCRKSGTQLNITQHDAQQIQNYIASNNLVGFVQDTTGGDTSGIYYQIIQKPKTDTLLAYSDNISFVFSLKSFDGLYTSSDTIQNHYQGYLGHIVTDALPYGLELAIINDLKHYGGSMRVLIPSRLAYGRNGYGTGSSKVTSSHIAGNQCLDYYVHVISAQHDSATAAIARQNQTAYDQMVIKSYIASNSALAGLYSYDSSIGIYYRVSTPPSITDDITDNTTAEVNYTGYLMDNVVFDDHSAITDSTSVNIVDLIPGVQRVLKKYGGKGASVSMFIPSPLGYGQVAQSSSSGGVAIPVNSPLRFDFTILSVSP